jgi:hypothetical protein
LQLLILRMKNEIIFIEVSFHNRCLLRQQDYDQQIDVHRFDFSRAIRISNIVRVNPEQNSNIG